MPLYEYECKTCHKRTEKIQKFSDVEITICPHCGGELERTITAPAVHFAGGGWYKEGYGNAKPPATSGGESGSEKSEKSEKSDGGTPAAASSDAAGAKSSEKSGDSASSAPAASPAPAAAPAASSTPAKS
jgi:putative FmdB family regulatory protein